MSTQSLDALFQPQSIAIFGASDKVSSWSLEIHSNLEDFGYNGPIFPVNPRRATVWGRETFKRLKDVPEPVELAIIAVPAAAAVDAVSACDEEGIPAALVVSSGFRDAGEEGAIVQEQLVAAATNGNVAVLGPNVEGFINTRDRVAGYGAELPPTPTVSAISMFSQSGTAAWAFAHMAGDRGTGLRLVAGVGVEATLGIGDLLVWAAADPETSVVACYIETIRDLSKLSRGLDADLAIQQDGDEGLFRSYNSVDFLAPVYSGDFIEARGRIVEVGNTSRRCEFEAYKVISVRPDVNDSAADVLKEPTLVCRAVGTTGVPKDKKRV